VGVCSAGGLVLGQPTVPIVIIKTTVARNEIEILLVIKISLQCCPTPTRCGTLSTGTAELNECFWRRTRVLKNSSTLHERSLVGGQYPTTARERSTNLGTLFIPAGGVTSSPNIPANQLSPIVPIAYRLRPGREDMCLNPSKFAVLIVADLRFACFLQTIRRLTSYVDA